MGYIEETLGKDEKVIYQCNASKWGLVIPSIFLVFGLFAAFLLLGKSILFTTGAKILLYFFTFIGIPYFLLSFLSLISVELGFTNRRVVAKHGVIKRHAIELNITKVETVAVDQGIFGRMFNYGSLVISGAGNPQAPIEGIDKPMEFRRRLMEYLEEMKQGEAKA